MKTPTPPQTAHKPVASAIGTLLTGAIVGALAHFGLNLGPDLVGSIAVLAGALGGAIATYLKRNYLKE